MLNPQTCPHASTTLTYIIPEGRNYRHYHRQCLDCGKATTQFLKKDTLDPKEMEAATPFDRDLQQRAWQEVEAKRQQERDSLRQVQSKEWWAWYNVYLNSDKWKEKARRVRERDGGICQACCIRQATQVHHKTYEHVGDEPLFDLVSICDKCHDHLTAIDRARRQSA